MLSQPVPILGITMVILYLVVGILFGTWGYKKCEEKGRDPWLGAALGFFLGLIGILIVLALSERKRPIAGGLQGTYGLPPSGPAFPTQPVGQLAAAGAAQTYVGPSGQNYVAPNAQQFAPPQPPVAPVPVHQQYVQPPQPQQHAQPQQPQQYVPPQPPAGPPPA
jgi:hypothetical protein